MTERPNAKVPSRRQVVAGMGAGLAAMLSPAAASETIRLPLAGGPDERRVLGGFPQKGPMIVQRIRPPLLETPWSVFDEGVFTPNDRFFVRWHYITTPASIDIDQYRLTVRGKVKVPLSLSPAELIRDFPYFEIAAVNQCSGNSRGLFTPRVPGAQWGNGAMGNALWGGVRLKDVLDKAGVATGGRQVRFTGLDEAPMPDAPRYIKALDIDHARDGEVMIAFSMNGEPLPILNGFPLRLVVPGHFSTYWIKMLSDIEVLEQEDDGFWMKKAYRIPDTPYADIAPGGHPEKTRPIGPMAPRSFFTNLPPDGVVRRGEVVSLRGIAFGGDCGVRGVDLSFDGGMTWRPATLGADEGKYGFRRWAAEFTPAKAGEYAIGVRCRNTRDETQPSNPNWNPGGFLCNVIETATLVAV